MKQTCGFLRVQLMQNIGSPGKQKCYGLWMVTSGKTTSFLGPQDLLDRVCLAWIWSHDSDGESDLGDTT